MAYYTICVNSVSVSPKTLTLKVGNWYYAASAEVCPTNATCKDITWHSANPAVATVNAASGYIYAKAAGTAKIYATATDGSGCTDYLTVTVTNAAIKVTSISLSNTSLTLEKGDSHTLSATVYPTNATNKTLHWYSDNPTVAPVCDGVVCALAKGTATITASATDGSGKSASCTVSVTEDVLVTSVNIKSSTKRIQIGNSFFLETTVTPANATNCKLLWTSNDPEVATVNPDSGLVCTKTLGTARITATAQDGSGKYDHCNITVVPVPVECVRIDQDDIELRVGELCELTAIVCPENATTPEVEWKSSNERVATVEWDSGVLAAWQEGTATIYAISKDNECICDCRTVTVLPPIPVTHVQISPAPQTMNVGETATLSAMVFPENATNKKVVWSSSNPNVVSVNAYGQVTANAPGIAYVFATAQDNQEISDACTIYCDRYLYELVYTFGFTQDVALLIRQLYDKVDALFPTETTTERAWKCSRLLSEFSYDDFKFNDVAGSLTNQENRESYFMNTLGYAENEYNTLGTALSDNHNDGDTIDFTHLQYSLAARLAYTLDKDGWASNLGSQFKTGNWGTYSDEDISYLGGWLGDATLRNDGGTGVPILKNDDYMSDLDAENIYRLLLQGYTSIDALNVYYSSMNESNTRADIFLQYIPYSTVKQKIFYELIDAKLYMFSSNASSQGDIYMTNYWLNLINNEEYHFNEIKSKYSDTYDFLMSLNDRLSTIKHYP